MPETLEDFLQTARERFDFGRLADADDRTAAEYDNRFANADNKNLDQWDKEAKKARKKRPVIQWNRVHVSIQQVVNDGRQNKPSVQIAPADEGASADTAEYFKARIRHIEYESNVDTAKDTARDQQVTTGRGFIRVRTEYIPGSRRQRIKVDRIDNQFSVVWDPAAIAYDRSDADWAFIVSLISEDAHKRKYGKNSLVNRLDFADATKLAPEWIGLGDDGKMIQIAEYFVKEYTPRTFNEGGITWTEQCPTITQYVINGAEILSKTTWIGSTIPIIPFWGREATIDGRRRTYSLTRAAIYPQQMLNIYVSNLAELIGQMPKSPWAVPVGGIPAGQEEVYKNVNNVAVAYLLYEAYSPDGKPLPPPSRITAEPPIQACVIGIQQCIDAIKAAMGIYDASMGAKSNETSGIAIERRRKQSNITNYHFPDNEARSNKYLGEVLVEVIRKVDQPGSVNPIRTEDGKTHLVPIGQEHQDWKTGETVCHDLMSGQYGTSVSTGPSHQSQREEAFDRDVALVQADPTLMWVIGDQMFASDDTAGSQERAERMKAAINMKTPGLIQEKGQQDPLPPQVQQQIVGMQQQLQASQQFAASMHEQIARKQFEAESAEKLKQMDLTFKREELAENSRVELVKAGSVADIAALRAEIEALKHESGLRSQAYQQDATRTHAAGMAERQIQAKQQAQESEHAHGAEMADKTHQATMEQTEQAAELAPQPQGA